jgi:hypothetical protein
MTQDGEDVHRELHSLTVVPPVQGSNILDASAKLIAPPGQAELSKTA